jgi:hypothetical protein
MIDKIYNIELVCCRASQKGPSGWLCNWRIVKHKKNSWGGGKYILPFVFKDSNVKKDEFTDVSMSVRTFFSFHIIVFAT